MAKVEPRVELLAHTPHATELIYAAFRQCYHVGFVGDMWTKLLSEEINKKKQESFIQKMVASGHESPLEHASFTFALSGVSRALTHQLVRHRLASYSQQSQRYVESSNFGFVVPPAILTNPRALDIFEDSMQEIQQAYDKIKMLLEADGRGDKAAEDARFVLPQAVETRIVFSMNCRSLLNFFEQRCCTRAQWEIQEVANQCLKLCQEALPAVFRNAGAKCEKLSYCPEGEKYTCGRCPLREKLSYSSEGEKYTCGRHPLP